uniref:Large ribosomal subunit protein bL33m n=1 Tax=Cyprinodon variegatus TaxID=28743 RepID=A0A3Q2GAG5_CYPVA
MFLTSVNLAKAKSKTILVQMVSAAGTGYFFNTKRNRLREKLVLRKHDPFGKMAKRRAASLAFSLMETTKDYRFGPVGLQRSVVEL